jgi:WXG100 family type VII secretion target
MTTDRIAATQGALRAGADAVHAAHDDVADTVGRIQRELDELGPAWTGIAADGHVAMMRQWGADVEKLQTTLARLEESLRATERDQAATEESHIQAITGLGSMMTGA